MTDDLARVAALQLFADHEDPTACAVTVLWLGGLDCLGLGEYPASRRIFEALLSMAGAPIPFLVSAAGAA